MSKKTSKSSAPKTDENIKNVRRKLVKRIQQTVNANWPAGLAAKVENNEEFIKKKGNKRLETKRLQTGANLLRITNGSRYKSGG